MLTLYLITNLSIYERYLSLQVGILSYFYIYRRNLGNVFNLYSYKIYDSKRK